MFCRTCGKSLGVKDGHTSDYYICEDCSKTGYIEQIPYCDIAYKPYPTRYKEGDPPIEDDELQYLHELDNIIRRRVHYNHELKPRQLERLEQIRRLKNHDSIL